MAGALHKEPYSAVQCSAVQCRPGQLYPGQPEEAASLTLPDLPLDRYVEGVYRHSHGHTKSTDGSRDLKYPRSAETYVNSKKRGAHLPTI